jgi:transposase-like protein
MSERTRRQFTPAEKIRILRKHLIEKVAISDICEEYRLQPKLFYTWQQQFFEQGEIVFSQKIKSQRQNEQTQEQARIAQLEEKLSRKNEVVAELMEELIRSKKEAGALS